MQDRKRNVTENQNNTLFCHHYLRRRRTGRLYCPQIPAACALAVCGLCSRSFAKNRCAGKNRSGITERKNSADRYVRRPAFIFGFRLGSGGVFILVVKSDTEKTPAIAQEISYAANAIATQGMRMGVFQLASGTQDYEFINSQLPSPGVVVVIKGRGMRAVAGKNITKTNLLQACIAAMQPSSCCPAGGNRVCK